MRVARKPRDTGARPRPPENVIERAVAVSPGRDTSVRFERLPASITGLNGIVLEGIHIPPEGVDFESHVSQVEKQFLEAALETSGGVRSQAADLLKMSYRSFRHCAKKHGI